MGQQTYEQWFTRLKSGGYNGIGGARKGVGKSSWPDEVKTKAYKELERHFGAAAVAKPAKKSADKKTPKVKHERAAALGPKKTGPMAERQRKLSKPRGRRPAAESTIEETLKQVQVANEKIKTVAAAREQLERGHVTNETSMRLINDIVVGAVRDLHKHIFGDAPVGGNGRPEPPTPPDVVARMRAAAASGAELENRTPTL